MLLTIFLAALAAALGAAWGAFWALVRDQDGPYPKGKPPGAGSNKWKECGLVVFGLPLSILWIILHGTGTETLIEAAVIWLGMGGAWALGHDKGLGLDSREAYLAMAWTGAAVTLAPALVMGWHLAFIPALAALLSGAAKVLTYELGYRIRGRGSHPYPHATEIGHVGHGLVAYSVSAAAMVMA